MAASFATALERAWFSGASWVLLLLPLELLFIALSALRRFAYARGFLASYRAPCAVVVVGNILVGGTGKTPVVIALARGLHERGYRVGVVCRGYGGQQQVEPRRVLAGQSDAKSVGDEALMIAEATGLPVVVSSDRAAAVRTLLEEGIDIAVSDDGLQHYALQRDFEIAMLDSARGLGNGHRLPVGPLREPPSRLTTVDWVLQRGGPDPASACPLRVVALENLSSGEVRTVDSDTMPTFVHAVTGIGNPEAFFATLRELGMQVEPHIYPDHHQFSSGDLAPLREATVVMTAKDAVKCRPFAGPDHWVLQVDVELPAGLLEAVEQRAAAARSTA